MKGKPCQTRAMQAKDMTRLMQPNWQRQAVFNVLHLFALGLPLALAAFWLFPRLPTPLWGLPERSVAKPGLSDSMTPGGMIDMPLDDSPAARVQFSLAPPHVRIR